MSLKRRIAAIGIVLMAMVVPVTVATQVVDGVTQSAEAADFNRPSRIYKPNNGWVAMYPVPRVTNYPTTWLKSGAVFYMDCYVDHSWYYGNYNSNRWFWGYGGGYWAYVHSSFVTNQIGVRRC